MLTFLLCLWQTAGVPALLSPWNIFRLSTGQKKIPGFGAFICLHLFGRELLEHLAGKLWALPWRLQEMSQFLCRLLSFVFFFLFGCTWSFLLFISLGPFIESQTQCLVIFAQFFKSSVLSETALWSCGVLFSTACFWVTGRMVALF